MILLQWIFWVCFSRGVQKQFDQFDMLIGMTALLSIAFRFISQQNQNLLSFAAC
jgi:hypothetical protein